MKNKSSPILAPYLFFQTFFQLLLWIPVYYHFQKKIGLNDSQIFTIQSWYYLIFVFFEIPTGYFSDRFGHKSCIKVGSFILAVANFVPVLVQSYHSIFIHFIAIALSRALLSGAASAYLYEYLKEIQHLELYKETEGKARSFALIARVIGYSLVAPLMAYNLFAPYVLTTLFTSLAFVFAFFLPELQFKKRESKFFKDIIIIPKLLKENPTLILFMANGIGLFLLARICQINLFQPILEMKNFPLKTFGIIMALMTALEAFGARYSHKLKGLINDLSALYLMSLTLCISFLFLSYGEKGFVLIGFIIFSLATGAAFPMQKQLVNNAIVESHYRATFLSLESMLNRIVAAVVVSFAGGFVKEGKITDYLLYSAIGTGIFITFIYLLLNLKLFPRSLK